MTRRTFFYKAAAAIGAVCVTPFVAKVPRKVDHYRSRPGYVIHSDAEAKRRIDAMIAETQKVLMWKMNRSFELPKMV